MTTYASIALLALIVGSLLSAQNYRQAHTFSGTVVDTSGNPISDVSVGREIVADWSSFPGEARKQIQAHGTVPSDRSGSFQIETMASCIVARKIGFRSKLLRPSDSTPARIVLQPSTKPPIRACAFDKCQTMSSPGGMSLGDGHGFKITKPATDVDYSYQNFALRLHHGWQVIRHGIGSMYSLGIPIESMVCNGTDFDEVVSQRNGITYVDARGRNTDGTLWRYFGTVGESADYWKTDAAAARKLDELLDNLCIMKPAVAVRP